MQAPVCNQAAATGWTAPLKAKIHVAAEEAGFDLSEIAAAEPLSDASTDSRPEDRFAAWVEAGHAGEMEYLKRRDASGVFLRSDLRVAIPWARSVVVCAWDYSSAEVRSIEEAPPEAGWIGRYAWSGRKEQIEGASQPAAVRATDYHEELLGKLKVVEDRLQQETACETRCYVDTGPILERDFAAKAGIGWIGKNTCVLNQERGSWLLLGVIVTSLPIPVETVPPLATDRCGSCTRCIDACPTHALVAPREMDASLCIAYLTIEKKGQIPSELREAMGRQVFGCDICQDVCPWNTRSNRGKLQSPLTKTSGMEIRPELVNPSLTWLAEMDAKVFKRWFKGSPLERTGRKRLHRNVAIAMGNSADRRFLPQLLEWAAGEDQTLAEAAQWAIERIHSASIGV